MLLAFLFFSFKQTCVLSEYVAEIGRHNMKFIRKRQRGIQPGRRCVVNGNLLCRVVTTAFLVVRAILVAALVFDVIFGLVVGALEVLELRIVVDVAVANEINHQLVEDETMRIYLWRQYRERSSYWPEFDQDSLQSAWSF